MNRALAAVPMLAFALASSAFANDLPADLKDRRARVISALDGATMLVAWSAPPKVYSRDIEYEYRQDSNMLYLTGITQENTILVLMPGNEKKREILFIEEPNPRREHWTGHMLTKEEAAAASGIETVYFTSQFEPFVTAMFSGEAFDSRRTEDVTEFDAFFDAVRHGAAKMSLLFGRRPAPSAPLTAPYDFARQARDRFIGVTFTDSTPLVENLRQVKTEYEQRLLERSLQILERCSPRRDARGRTGQVRIRGRGGDRADVPRQRRDELVVSVHRRAAGRTPPSCTTPRRAGAWNPGTCCSSMRPPTTRGCRATSRARTRCPARSRRRRSRFTASSSPRRTPRCSAAKAGNRTRRHRARR